MLEGAMRLHDFLDYWARERPGAEFVFGGGRDVVGRAIQLNGEPYTVVGVAPIGFGLTSKVDAWLPMAFKPAVFRAGGRRWRTAICAI